MADVICPGCNGKYHRTTAQYRKNQPVNGTMLTLKDEFVGYGWTSFPEVKEQQYASLECPNCGTPYPNQAGRIAVEVEKKTFGAKL